jgi:hypothetical protein
MGDPALGKPQVQVAVGLAAAVIAHGDAREARWALEAAQVDAAPIVRHGEQAPSLFLPRRLSDAERAVRHVLGALAVASRPRSQARQARSRGT